MTVEAVTYSVEVVKTQTNGYVDAFGVAIRPPLAEDQAAQTAEILSARVVNFNDFSTITISESLLNHVLAYVGDRVGYGSHQQKGHRLHTNIGNIVSIVINNAKT